MRMEKLPRMLAVLYGDGPDPGPGNRAADGNGNDDRDPTEPARSPGSAGGEFEGHDPLTAFRRESSDHD